MLSFWNLVQLNCQYAQEEVASGLFITLSWESKTHQEMGLAMFANRVNSSECFTERVICPLCMYSHMHGHTSYWGSHNSSQDLLFAGVLGKEAAEKLVLQASQAVIFHKFQCFLQPVNLLFISYKCRFAVQSCFSCWLFVPFPFLWRREGMYIQKNFQEAIRVPYCFLISTRPN